MYTYIHTYIHTYMHAYLPTYLPTYLHTYIHTYIILTDLHQTWEGGWNYVFAWKAPIATFGCKNKWGIPHFNKNSCLVCKEKNNKKLVLRHVLQGGLLHWGPQCGWPTAILHWSPWVVTPMPRSQPRSVKMLGWCFLTQINGLVGKYEAETIDIFPRKIRGFPVSIFLPIHWPNLSQITCFGIMADFTFFWHTMRFFFWYLDKKIDQLRVFGPFHGLWKTAHV